MKYLLLILLSPSLLQAQSKAISKDKTVEISTMDPNIMLEYMGHSEDAGMTVNFASFANAKMDDVCGGYGYNKGVTKTKYDTIGGWYLVSDTSKGWNPVSAMYLYEIIKYTPTISGNRKEDGWPFAIPEHYRWLDSNKKPIYLKVWQAQ